MELDLYQLAQELQRPEPGSEQRAAALRGQQALGLLGTVAQGQVGKFGQNLYSTAERGMQDLRDEQTRGLDRATKRVNLYSGLRDLTAPQDQYDFQTVDKKLYRVNPRTGEAMLVAGGGEPVQSWTGEGIPAGIDLNESQGKAFTQTMSAMRGYQQLQDLFDSGYKPGQVAQRLYETGGGGITGRIAGGLSDAGDQNYVSVGMAVVDAILRAQTGAQAPEAEVRSYAVQWLPQWYEEPEVQQAKMQRLQNMIRDLAPRAGESAAPYLTGQMNRYLQGEVEDI